MKYTENDMIGFALDFTLHRVRAMSDDKKGMSAEDYFKEWKTKNKPHESKL